jgi:hypothetical protein
MTLNVFTQSKEAFEHAIEAPNLGLAFVIVLLTGLFWSGLSLIVFNDIFSASVLIFINIIQWIILGVLLFVFEILFSGQKKHQIRADFKSSLSVVGKLYIFALVTAILFNLYVFNFGSLIATAAGLLILIVSIISLYASFIAVRTVLDSSNSRAFVVWILLIITYFLLLAIANLVTSSLII